MTICIGNVWFDVIDRCTVHQVGSFHIDHRTKIPILLYPVDADTREAQVVGTERRARGKDAHPLVSSQTGRTNRQTLRGGVG